jgi:hypothetical protein
LTDLGAGYQATIEMAVTFQYGPNLYAPLTEVVEISIAAGSIGM